MNPHKHAEISVATRGGSIEDYYAIHSFLDCTKELCGDNRHRILHNMWAVRRIVIPMFGATIENSDGKLVNTKDLCEQDHLLADFRNRFVPTLGDFVDAIEEPRDLSSRLDRALSVFPNHPEVRKLVLSPLYLTGQRKSLLITLNSWFLGSIVPELFDVDPGECCDALSPSTLFDSLQFKPWMDNGAGDPPSFSKLRRTNQN